MVEQCQWSIGYPRLTELIKTNTEKLVGEVLTVFEMVLPEGSSRDATKLMTKQIIWRWHNRVLEDVMTNINKEE